MKTEVSLFRRPPYWCEAMVVGNLAQNSAEVLVGFGENLRPLYRVVYAISVVGAQANLRGADMRTWDEVHIRRRNKVLYIGRVCYG